MTSVKSHECYCIEESAPIDNHDEYGYSEVSFTYGAWENHSAFLHPPSDLLIRALVGSLDMLSMELELELQKIIAANNGFLRPLLRRGYGRGLPF
jgi:hypothetical protein